MKKILSLLLMVTLCVSLAACGNQSDTANDTVVSETTDREDAQNAKDDSQTAESAAGEGTPTDQEISTEPDIPAEPEASIEQDTPTDQETSTEPDTTAEPEVSIEQEAPSDQEAQPETGSNILVVYFSATGNTRAVAESIADGLQADIFEIVPEEPYTAEDLNYNDDNSRSTQEMSDSSARPAIAAEIENFEQYDTVFLGYPIWWGEAPRILDTFVENYDFTDKLVIPFCTSASSGVGSSAVSLEFLAGTGEWMNGQRFDEDASVDDVLEWARQFE